MGGKSVSFGLMMKIQQNDSVQIQIISVKPLTL